MNRSVFETILGAVVLLTAGFFLIFSYKTADVASVDGYNVTAYFSALGGLKIGDDVTVSGVKVGTVTKVELDIERYLAEVTLSIEDEVKLPTDTAALISSESLLGGKFLTLEPGADDEYIESGGTIDITQAPQNLEQLLGQFIFSMQGSDKE